MTVPHMFALMATGGAGGGGISSPLDIADCTLWLDAADTGSITESGGAVSQWSDKSADARHYTQATGSAKPTTNATTQNSLNVLNFDGGDYLSLGSAWMRTALAADGLTLFIVARRASGSDMDLMGEGRTSNGTPFARFTSAPTTNAQVFDHRSDANVRTTFTSTGNFNDTNWHLALWLFRDIAPNHLVMAIDGVTGHDAALGGIGAVTLNTNTIGALQRTSVTNFWNGSMAEIVAYDRELDSTEVAQVEAYLTAKWGL
jgi:hypothetical protein